MKDNKLNLCFLAFTIVTISVAIYFGLAKQRYVYENDTCFDTKMGKLYYIDYEINEVYEIDYVSGNKTTRKYKKYVE
jgi:hypothetical protein